MENQPVDVETHKRLLFAIVEYLHSLGEGDLALKLGFQADNISIAEDLLSHVSGLSISNPEHVQKYSIKPMSLPNIFGLGLARKEQLEQAIGHLNKAEQAPQVSVPKRHEYGFNDPNLEEKFRAYLELIRSRGYFNGVEENTPAYQERVENAKKRFAARYAQENPQESASPNVTPVNAAPATPVNTTPAQLSDEERLKLAEQYKVEGNDRLANKKFQEAIVSYSKAIDLNKSNAIYYSNRAAAYSHIGQHHKAIEDCKQAITIDPLYVKAYSRLGLAYFSLGKYKEAVEQGYKKALEIEPHNTAIKESLSAAEAKIRELQNVSPVPNMGGMGGMPAMPNMGGMPNLGGMGANPAGGMPDLGAMMNNPGFQNAFQNFAQNLGQGGGGLGGLLNNPAIQQMMNSPQVQQMMNNPQMMQMMMQQMMNNPQIMDIAQNLAQNPDVQNLINQQPQQDNPDAQQ